VLGIGDYCRSYGGELGPALAQFQRFFRWTPSRVSLVYLLGPFFRALLAVFPQFATLLLSPQSTLLFFCHYFSFPFTGQIDCAGG